VESRILEAIEDGLFDNLPGAGQPLRFDPGEYLAGDNWLAFHILSNAGVLPPWLELGREIERAQQELARIDAAHASAIALAEESREPRHRRAVEVWREAYQLAARNLHARQQSFNAGAPGLRNERPAIWVEHHLERLRERERGLARANP
jgi:hypothetical protein